MNEPQLDTDADENEPQMEDGNELQHTDAEENEPQMVDGNELQHTDAEENEHTHGEREDEDDVDENGQDNYDIENEDNYADSLHALSKKWQFTQVTHKVSEKAANVFWDYAFNYIPRIMEFKEREGRLNNVPKFSQQRRKLKKCCPEVKMEFAFKNKIDGSIVKHSASTTPVKALEQNPEYVKLYEIATIEVKLHY